MRAPLQTVLLAALWLSVAAYPAFAQTTQQTNQQLSLPIDGASVSNINGHATKLGANDTALISAPIAIDLPGTPAGGSSCYAIKNLSANSYFVPWNTPNEWSSFLGAVGASGQLSVALGLPATPAVAPWLNQISISSCCSPQPVGTICTTSNTTITSDAQLGNRYVGTPGGDSPYWGADKDVYYVDASQVSGNSSIDYTATWTCKAGTWVKTHESGSCVPMDGQCAAGSSGLTALPNDTDSLCAQGSIFGGFTNPGGTTSTGPWTWLCKGTPGMADAQCTSAGTNQGCGTATQDGPTWAPPAANLCQGNATASPVTGPGPWNTSNGASITLANTVWSWTCTDGTGTISSCTEAYPADCANGTGDVVNGVLGTTAPNPNTQLLCASGTPSAITYQDDPWGFMTKKAWIWTCNIGQDAYSTCAIFDQNSGSMTDGDPHPGICGPASYGQYSDAPTSGLCSQGTTTGAWSDGWSWFWTCVGSTGENTGCIAAYVQDGQCGSAAGVASSTPPASGLCNLGWPGQITSDGSNWAWTCNNSQADPVTCTAPETPATGGGSLPADACGSANGGTFASAPAANLCAGGFASSVADTGNGQWIWTCTAGTNTANCTATNTNTGPGICGAANGTTIPNVPNQNLCSSGGASAVSGNGPWVWNCLGDGGSSGQNASCTANYCQACTGTVGSTTVTTPTISGTYGGCNVTGYASYTLASGLNSSGQNMKLQWTDTFYGNYSAILSASGGPAYDCQPCHTVAQSVSNVQVTVVAPQGSCPGNGQINSGHPFTYGVSNATLTPQ